ncbi:MAG TPA: RNA polymerase sigma factor [Solirubrobacterales bacterium]|nr:RNA polymerase sigma factor [Solirubrobacterales bacterium]
MPERPSATWPSQSVISAAREGNPEALATLVAGSHEHVRRFARTLCSTPQDAEDAAQEALIVLYRRIGTLRATAALASWMFKVVLRECIRRSSLSIRHRPLPIDPEAADSTEDTVLNRLEIERVVASIATLPAEQRTVLVLRDVQGLSGAATAEALGLSRAAMKSRLHRARESVRSQLGAPSPAGDAAGAEDA